MANKFIKLLEWLKRENRFKHLLVGFLTAALFGIGASLTAGVVAEYKDWCYLGQRGGPLGVLKSKNGFKWKHLLITVIGGLFGALLHYFAFHHIHL